MGVWLPLALSQIYQMLFILVRMWAKNAEEIKVPTMSDALASFCLPMMAKSMKADEEEQEALALLKAVEKLKAKQQQADNSKQ